MNIELFITFILRGTFVGVMAGLWELAGAVFWCQFLTLTFIFQGVAKESVLHPDAEYFHGVYRFNNRFQHAFTSKKIARSLGRWQKSCR